MSLPSLSPNHRCNVWAQPTIAYEAGNDKASNAYLAAAIAATRAATPASAESSELKN